MTIVISTINLKGGVGKTQMTIALAEFLSLKFGKKTLLIDLDPQTNATVSLIDENNWLNKDNNGETLLQLFRDKLKKTSKFDIKKAIIHKVSNIEGGIENLDLLPSSLGLIDIQDSLALIPSGEFYISTPITILKEAIQNIIDSYDFILIDCPPNLGILTVNALRASDYLIIPLEMSFFSLYALGQLLDIINLFDEKLNHKIDWRVLITMFDFSPEER